MSRFCKNCGAALDDDALFCTSCGHKLEVKEIVESTPVPTGAGTPLGLSYLFSVLGTVIAVIARLAQQAVHRYYVSFDNYEYFLCIAREDKPKYMLIPLISGILATLMVLCNRSKNAQSKLLTFFLNMVFVAASVIIIWYEAQRGFRDWW